jgi:hypothetical protein
MLQSNFSNLKYDDYDKINEMIEGYTNIDSANSTNLALANRPLPSKKQCPCLKEGRNDLKQVKPYYDNNDFKKSTNSSDNETPVIIKKQRDQYFVLENETDDDVYNDSWADLPAKKENHKMNWVTQFYFGSLSIVSLFVVFRMIQKTR